MRLRISVLLIFGFQIILMGLAVAGSYAPFPGLVGETGWQVNVRDVTMGVRVNDIQFELRMGDEHYFSFKAYQGNDPYSNRLGPLQEKYLPRLLELLNAGSSFMGQEETSPSSMAIHWFSYPESIRNWTLIWKESELKKNWDQTDPYKRHDSLVKMISDSLKQDFQPIVRALGFDITGASMEKMGFQKAGSLKFYGPVLKPAEIPGEFKIPIPLILSLRLNPSTEISERDSVTKGEAPCWLNSFFSIASQGKKTIYCSFQRPFDQYEISGDRRLPDGRHKPVRPFIEKEYQGISAKLLRAALISTRRDSKNPVSLRLNIPNYPGLYQEMTAYFSETVGSQTQIQRTGLPKLIFYRFHPSTETGFQESIAPFLGLAGLKFKEFQVSLNHKKTAGKYDTYDTLLKPLGFKPEDRPAVPDFVYMMVEKN
ncbi:hypothetical protein [Desulfospira joergensenii]|uniref:hypothetical protein n=1 Tax=Desulfospira joergensenii TaxID=53329 RepID=UPI0003B6E340|nr:hypothetical protein [Desulfospira joergensenii]